MRKKSARMKPRKAPKSYGKGVKGSRLGAKREYGKK